MSQSPGPGAPADDFAEQVREACIREALRAYEDAGISGLCHEGRFEAAISAMRVFELPPAPQPR